MSKREELVKALNGVYAGIESAISDENIKTVGKVIEKQNDELGSIIQGIEDGDYDEPAEDEQDDKYHKE